MSRPPPIAAGDHDAPATAEKADQGFRLCFGHRELEPLLGLRLLKRSEQFPLDHRAEPAKLAQPPGLDDLPKVVEGAHFQPVIEQLDALGSQAGKRRHIAKFAGELFLQRIEQSETSGFDDIGDLAGQVLSDPGQLRQIASGFQQASDRLGQALDDTRGTTIGADAKLVLSCDLEEFGGLVEHRCDFRVLHGHVEKPTKMADGSRNRSSLSRGATA